MYVFSHIKSDNIKEELIEIIKRYTNISSEEIILMLLEHKQQGYKGNLTSIIEN